MTVISSGLSFIWELASKLILSVSPDLLCRDVSDSSVADVSIRKLPSPGRSRRLCIYKYWASKGANRKLCILMSVSYIFSTGLSL